MTSTLVKPKRCAGVSLSPVGRQRIEYHEVLLKSNKVPLELANEVLVIWGRGARSEEDKAVLDRLETFLLK